MGIVKPRPSKEVSNLMYVIGAMCALRPSHQPCGPLSPLVSMLDSSYLYPLLSWSTPPPTLKLGVRGLCQDALTSSLQNTLYKNAIVHSRYFLPAMDPNFSIHTASVPQLVIEVVETCEVTHTQRERETYNMTIHIYI